MKGKGCLWYLLLGNFVFWRDVEQAFLGDLNIKFKVTWNRSLHVQKFIQLLSQVYSWSKNNITKTCVPQKVEAHLGIMQQEITSSLSFRVLPVEKAQERISFTMVWGMDPQFQKGGYRSSNLQCRGDCTLAPSILPLQTEHTIGRVVGTFF